MTVTGHWSYNLYVVAEWQGQEDDGRETLREMDGCARWQDVCTAEGTLRLMAAYWRLGGQARVESVEKWSGGEGMG